MGGVSGGGVGNVGMASGGWFKQGGGVAGVGGVGGVAGGMLGMRAPYASGGAPRLSARYFPGGVGVGVGGVLQRSPPATPSPRPPTPSELLLLRQSPAPAAPHHAPDDQPPPMTPQDQLTKFVEQL